MNGSGLHVLGLWFKSCFLLFKKLPTTGMIFTIHPLSKQPYVKRFEPSFSACCIPSPWEWMSKAATVTPELIPAARYLRHAGIALDMDAAHVHHQRLGSSLYCSSSGRGRLYLCTTHSFLITLQQKNTFSTSAQTMWHWRNEETSGSSSSASISD